MKKWIIGFIIISLISGSVITFSLGRIFELESNLSSLKADYDNLTALFNKVNTSYIETLRKYETFISDYDELASEFQSLKANYDALNSSYNEILRKYDSLKANYEALNTSYSEILREYDSLVANYSVLSEAYAALESSYEEEVANLLAENEQLRAKIIELEQRSECKVYVLEDKSYYYAIRKDLENANKSIMVAMYSMIYDPDDSFDWANDLIRDLVAAKNRGIDVTVIIEYRTYFGYIDGNLEAYDYLLQNGINVRLDDESDTDHMKLVIIDGYIVYIGSHNWSESSLYYNHETSAKIISEEIAKTLREYFSTI